MKLKDLITLTDKTIYQNTNSYKIVISKQKELLEIIGEDTDINKIDYKIISKYIETLRANNNQPTTINCKLAYLRTILNYAYNNRIIKNKPYIKSLKQTKATKTLYFTDEEISMMLQYCLINNLQQLEQVILIGLNLGLRISEILAINPTINIQDNYYRSYNNKTNNETSIPLNKTMQDLFYSNKFTRFTVDYPAIHYQFKKMLTALNIKDKTIHTLRHTFCSKLVQNDVAIPVIQKLANHKSINTTLRYAHISDKQLEKAINML